MSDPEASFPPTSPNPDEKTILSDPNVGEVKTHSSMEPQQQTSSGETRSATPVSTVVGVGSQLGPYKLVDKLGEGGMGAVYKARHTKLGKFVAMKILPQHVMSRSDALARFEREMLAVGSLHHPNIVQAHDAGEFGGVHYLSMEYVEGQDLQQFVKAKGPMSVVNACKAIRQAAQGLAAAHKLGLVHRDIKPSNLFVTKQSGQIKILDMGLALLSQEEVPAALTSTGQCFGTPDYMAPEQWNDAHTCDARADLYSLGCTLFFLLVGHPPYHSETHRTAANKMKGHVIDPIPDLLAARSAAVGWKSTSDRSSSLHSSPPSSGERQGEGADFKTGPLTLTLSPEDGGRGDKRTDEGVSPTSDIPDELNAIYRKLMAKDPKDRFASADQLAEALAPFTRQSKPAPSSPHAPREESPTISGTSKRSNSDAAPTQTSESLAPAIVSRSETATLSEPPADQLGATSTWAGSSNAAASRSSGTSQAEAGPQAAAPRQPNRNRLFIAGGGAAFVLLLGVIIITITNKDGSKTKIEVPGDAKVEITTKGDEVPTKTGWHGWPADAPKPAIAPFNADEARQYQEAWAKYLYVPVEYTNSIGMKFRLIPPGEFMMGSTKDEVDAILNEVDSTEKRIKDSIQSAGPRHRVILTQPIYMGVNEVTQGDYEKVMGTNPSYFSPTGPGKEVVAEMETTHHPVEMVSWNDAADFCSKLSKQEKLKPFYFRSGETITPLDGTGYRLPSEAEWEFSCRAGTVTKYWIGDKDEDLVRVGWFGGNSGSRTHPAGELKANPFRLFDTHGNVWEWVQDRWDPHFYAQFQEEPAIDPCSPFSSGPQRVAHGGEFLEFHPDICSASYRNGADQAAVWRGTGFRASLPVDAVRQALKVTGPAIPPSGASDTRSGSRETSDDARSTARSPSHRSLTTSATKTETLPANFTNSLGMEFVKVPKGTGWLGGGGGKPGEQKVEFTDDFYLGKYEVTQEEWEKVTGLNPSHFSRTGEGKEAVKDISDADLKRFPVEMVSWDDAQLFLERLNKQAASAGWIYRLPKEDEWEYACRGGPVDRSQSAFDYYLDVPSNELRDGQANFGRGDSGRTCANGSYKPNSLGLHDMHGNVHVWCQDRVSSPDGLQSDSHRVLRGGSYWSDSSFCRVTTRFIHEPFYKHRNIGLRVARVRIGTTQPKPEVTSQLGSPSSTAGWHGWPADAPKPAIAPFDAAQAKKHQEEWAKYLNLPVQWTNSIGMTFQLIPPAEFTMGSSPEQVAATVKVYGDASWKNWAPSEGPQHRVVLTRPFYLGTHEVRQRDYESVMGRNPSGFAKTGKNPMYADLVKGLDTSDHPVETVSWFDAAEFCAKLAMNEGLSPAYATGMRPTFPIEGNGYRLPTEAEWEFTARAGSTTDSWNGDGPACLVEIAWCAANSGGRTHPVGQRLANPFGVFDMQGQVWEWCQDGWTQDGYQRRVAAPVIDPLEAPGQYVRKVVRGSFVTDDLAFSYATIRRALDPNYHGASGLRVAIGIDAVAAKLNRPLPKQTAPIAKSNPFVASSDWKAARFLLDQGAAISIRLGGTYVDLSGRDKPLPMEPFRLVLVWCADASRLTKDQIRELSQCQSLMSLTLAQLSLTDDDVKPLTEIRSLSSLNLSGPKLTTQSLAAFAGASQLEVFSNWDTLPAESMSDALSKLTRLRDARVRYLKAEDLLEWSKQPSFARIRALHLGSPVGLTDDMIAEIQSRNPKVAIDVDNKIRGKWLTTDYINRMRSRGFVFIGKEYETNGAGLREIVVDSQNGLPTETPYAIFGLKIQPDATFTSDDLRELNLFHLLVSIDAADVPLNDEALEVLTANVAAGRLYTMNFSGTKISPLSIRWLARLARADSLDVRKTGFSRSMVDQLRRLLPETYVFSDFGDFPPEPAEFRAQDQRLSIDGIVARRIQELDGRGVLRVETLTWEFGKEDRLPELPYVVDNVYLLDASQVTAADLQNIARLRSLRNLTLLRLTVDDDALKPLEQLASLKTLALSGEKLSAKALAPFSSCPDLRDLNLPLVPRSGNISQALSDLSGLRSLGLFDLKAADVEAYSQSLGFSRLRWLDLKSASGVDDSVVSRLQERNPKLQVMIDGQIRGKNVVKEAINTLRQRGVTFSGAVVTAGGALVRAVKLDADTPPTDEIIAIDGLLIAADSDLTVEEWSSFDRLSRFDWIHSEGNPKVSDAHVAAIADRGNLDGLTLVGAQLTDASVESLARMRHLQLLNLRQTPLSRSAIERLRRLLPTTRIISEFGDDTPDAPTTGNDPRIPVDAERAAALKTLRADGLVMLQPLGASPWSIITVKPGEELPQGPFVIRSVNFRDRPDPEKVGDEVLRDLAECRHLEGLALSGTSVGPRGALYLGGSPALRYLHVSQKLPTSALRGLADLQALAAIELNVNSIDDDYAFLKSAKSLRVLALWGTQSPDWKKLGELTQLRVLIFPDATNLNADEVAAFQTARPECRVLFGNAAQRQMMGRNVIDEATSALLARKFEILGSRKWNVPAEWLAARKPDDPAVVYIQSVVLRAEVAATESDCVQIDLLNGELQQFHADGQALADRLAETISRNPVLVAVSFRNSELTDAGSAKLQSLTSLRSLILDRTRVTAAGVEKFRKAVPGCHVIFESETFDPQWLPTTHFDVNRRLAVRTLERGGTLLFLTQKTNWQPEPFSQPAALPAGRFVIDTLSLKNCPTVVSSDLEGIGELRNLLSLGFAGSLVDAEAIHHLRSLRGLVDFSPGHSSLKTSDLDQLPDWPQLDLLWLNTKMIDDGFKSLRRFPHLRTLNLAIDGPLPDLTPLGQFQNLRHVRFYPNSEVSSEVVRELQRRNPNLMVTTGDESGGRVLGENVARSAVRKLLELGVPLQFNESPSAPWKPMTLAEFDSVTSCQWYCPEIPAAVPFEVEHHELLSQMFLFQFKATGCRHADALAKALIEHQAVRSLELNNSDLTDEGLKELSKLRSLRGLHIMKTRVSRAAVEEFHRRVPDCWLQSDFGILPPTFVQEAGSSP